ncbi:hypothetical protein [Streptomyces vastus]|uniref:Uncharacterized protein n=1 Tax=Streptomyces vastus TaxID=285451 RepID=A0ABP6DFY6_9ACTN
MTPISTRSSSSPTPAFPSAETVAERLPVLTLGEAHQVLEVLLHVGKSTDDHAESARRLAMNSPRASPRPPEPTAVSQTAHFSRRIRVEHGTARISRTSGPSPAITAAVST